MRDEHCHILWDVDDGSPTFETSIAMLDAAARVGITDIVATPHMRWDDFDVDKVQAHFQQLLPEAHNRRLSMTLGFEVYYSTLMRKGLHTAEQFVEAGTNKLLVEFNTAREMADGWDRVFYELQTRYGLDLTLAHPERYITVLDDFDTVYRLKDLDVHIQVSAADLFHKAPFFSRSPLRGMAKCARRIIDEGLCDALVSDAHNVEHYQSYARAVKEFRR